MNRPALAVIGGMIAAALAVVIGVVSYQVHVRRSHQNPFVGPESQQSPDRRSATQPTAGQITPATKHEERFKQTYFDVIRAEFPALPTTRPLGNPLELGQAARFILQDPIYLNP